MNMAFEQSLQVRCKKHHFGYGPPFWTEQNTGNLRYFGHAFTASLVKKNAFVVNFIHQKQKSDSNSNSQEPDSSRNSEFTLHNLLYKQIQRVLA